MKTFDETEKYTTLFGSVGAFEIAMERKRQIYYEGFTADFDDKWTDGDLAKAAGCYAFHNTNIDEMTMSELLSYEWPFDDDWWKPANEFNFDIKQRKHELAKAGALIAAEIDRLTRIEEGENK